MQAPVPPGLNSAVTSALDDVDLSLHLSKSDEARRLAAGQRRLLQLRLTNGGQLSGGKLGPPVLVLFEGWDAAGKGGAISRLVAPLDSRHVRVVSYSAPTPDELRHHFLWRFFPSLPGWGGMAVFDRTWYGRVLVERVEGFATETQWRRAYEEITNLEVSLALEGMVLIKFWLHVSHEEQLRRFERRAADPLKGWKLGPEDWRNREKRPQYEAALTEMLERTDHPLGPWDVIPAEDKRYARVNVLETVITRMEEGMRREGIELPELTD
jgi:polyphosphate kinase 2 (PPK2 family)